MKDNLINQFFVADGEELRNGLIRKSVLLALIEDMKYCLNYPAKMKALGLTIPQISSLESHTPTFTILALFFMGIDVLSRVSARRLPRRGEDRSFFTETVIQFYGVEKQEAEALRLLRNDVIHSYKITDKCWVSLGGGKIIDQIISENRWHFCLRPMLSATQKASSLMYKLIMSQDDVRRLSTAQYLQDKGFYVVFNSR